jgi:hypothetical protein
MQNRQVTDWSVQALSLQSERLGPLPLVNHFLERLGLEALLDRFVPTLDRRVRLPYAKALLVLLRSVLVEREPLYRQGETVHGFCPAAFGLKAGEAVSDDAIGQGLDRLFDADRAGLLTAVIVAAAEAFDLRLSELHQDTTSISFCGQHRQARGRAMRGRRAPLITYGWSKAHRPDLKQLLWVLTTTADGAVPVQFRCEDGNTSDSRTHPATWDTLVKATGRADFLYVADSKLCSEAAMDHIDRRGGRFVCVLPRSRSEDSTEALESLQRPPRRASAPAPFPRADPPVPRARAAPLSGETLPACRTGPRTRHSSAKPAAAARDRTLSTSARARNTGRHASRSMRPPSPTIASPTACIRS